MSWSSALPSLPYHVSWCFNNCTLYGAWPAASRTLLFETREKYAGAMFNIRLRHLAWKPSKRCRYDLFSHAEPKEYNILLVTIA